LTPRNSLCYAQRTDSNFIKISLSLYSLKTYATQKRSVCQVKKSVLLFHPFFERLSFKTQNVVYYIQGGFYEKIIHYYLLLFCLDFSGRMQPKRKPGRSKQRRFI
jgi:hypothetical protein